MERSWELLPSTFQLGSLTPLTRSFWSHPPILILTLPLTNFSFFRRTSTVVHAKSAGASERFEFLGRGRERRWLPNHLGERHSRAIPAAFHGISNRTRKSAILISERSRYVFVEGGPTPEGSETTISLHPSLVIVSDQWSA